MNLVEKQSSDDWQNGVRLENRLRKIEEDLADLGRLVGWIVTGCVCGVVVLVAVLLFKH